MCKILLQNLNKNLFTDEPVFSDEHPLATFPNRPDSLFELFLRGGDVVSLLHAQVIYIIFIYLFITHPQD